MKRSVMPAAALGFRVHSGWAALVAVGGTPQTPAVVARRRIEIADPEIRGSKQPYHAAEGWPLAKAEEYLSRCAQRTKFLARRAVSAVVAELRGKGHDVVGSGVLAASGRPVPTLEEALSSHAMLHTAEGEFFRNALIEANEGCEVPVTRIKEKELLARGAQNFGIPVAELQQRVAELGRPLGPPWSQDEKYAALVGWMVLATAAQPSSRGSNRKSQG